MKKLFRFFWTAVCLALVLSMGLSAYADTGNVTYSGSSGEFIFAPGSRHSPTDLFPDLKNLMPGDSVTQRIVVKNDRFYGVKVNIFMRSKGAQLETDKFLSQLEMTVNQVGRTVMFKAPADRTAQLTEWTYLGTVYSGGEVILDVTIKVPLTMGDEYQNNIGYIDWEFKVEELDVSPFDPVGPRTGDTAQVVLYAAVACGSLGLMSVLILASRRKKSRE